MALPARGNSHVLAIGEFYDQSNGHIGFKMEMFARKREGKSEGKNGSWIRMFVRWGRGWRQDLLKLKSSQKEHQHLFLAKMQRYRSSAPEPVSVFSYPAAPKIAGFARAYSLAISVWDSNASAKLALTSNGGSYSTVEVTRQRSIFEDVSSAKRFSLPSSVRMTLRS